MKRFHIALAVRDIEASIPDYSRRLGCEPVCIIAGEYALWRSETLNFSIRKSPEQAGLVRHLGWEDPSAKAFDSEKDCNGMAWERFNAGLQAEEILATWPQSNYRAKDREEKS